MFFDKNFAKKVMACIYNKVERTTCIVISKKLDQIQHKLEVIKFNKYQTSTLTTKQLLGESA
jgi:hypothetical protein